MKVYKSVWCRHYTAYPEKTCQVGIAYDDMPRPRPCVHGSSNWGKCPQFAEYSQEELAEQEREGEEAIRTYLTALAEDKCPHCSTPIQRKNQVGRCAYAEPCGHRLYQGRA